jgi:hypothetical protein
MFFKDWLLLEVKPSPGTYPAITGHSEHRSGRFLSHPDSSGNIRPVFF